MSSVDPFSFGSPAFGVGSFGTPMNFSSYADFRSKFQQMFDGDDISQSDISANVLDMIIGLAEQRIYRELRSSTQEAPLSIVCSGNAALLPGDFLELKGSPYIGNGRATANFAPAQQLQDAIQLNTNTVTSGPNFYSFQSDAMIFYPPQADGTTIKGTYYRRFPDISTGLNAYFFRHPDVYLFASLAECGPFLGEMTRLPIWEKKYGDLVMAANEQERRRVTRGSKLQTRIG
jgi:hypothetical protein